jgi:putative mycofactocin binding protein MftB
MACAAFTDIVSNFEPTRPYRISPGVAVRPEKFGALLYDFGTRRLSFLKTLPLVTVVTTLSDHPDVHTALDDAGVPEGQRTTYLATLASLADAGTIQPR